VTVDIIAADWPGPRGIIAGATTRVGGVSDGAYESLNPGTHVGDEPMAVAENRRRIRNAFGLPAEPAWLEQVHGTAVATLSDECPQPDGPADAAVTGAAGIACVVMTADCLPVLLASGDGQWIGAVHAGWRGLAAGVIEAAIAAIPVPAQALQAWLGPAISQPAYEVGDEVRAAFVGDDPDAAAAFLRNDRGRWQADLYGLARRRLVLAGVTSVHGGGWCTSGDAARFFSHRRDGRTGRMATLVCRL